MYPRRFVLATTYLVCLLTLTRIPAARFDTTTVPAQHTLLAPTTAASFPYPAPLTPTALPPPQSNAYPPPPTAPSPAATPSAPTSSLTLITNHGQVLTLNNTIHHPDQLASLNPQGKPTRRVVPRQPPLTSTLAPSAVSPNAIIIGNRHSVTDTTAVPYLWVVNLDVTFPNGDAGFCSGWLYASASIATAGHCVYDQTRGGWAHIVATPGRNGPNPPYPFPTCTAIRTWTNSYWFGTSGVPAQRPFYDWAGLNTDCSYAELGHIGFEVREPATGEQAIVSGYPCEGIAAADLGKQFTSDGQVLGLEAFLLGENRIVAYNADQVACNSGSPVYRDNSYVFATATQANSDKNRGTLITEEVFLALLTGMSGPPTSVLLPLLAQS